MAVAKIISGNDIINGLAVVQPSVDGTIPSYDNRQRTQHILSATSGVHQWADLDTRFLFHGGAGGSGNWEH